MVAGQATRATSCRFRKIDPCTIETKTRRERGAIVANRSRDASTGITHKNIGESPDALGGGANAKKLALTVGRGMASLSILEPFSNFKDNSSRELPRGISFEKILFYSVWSMTNRTIPTLA